MNTSSDNIYSLIRQRQNSKTCVRTSDSDLHLFSLQCLTALKATSGVIRNRLFLSPGRHLLYISDLDNGVLTLKFEHLTCFFLGLLTLAASILDLPESEHQLYMWAAEGLCRIMYANQEGGLGLEINV
jgi:hypothetical protein